MRIKNYKLAAGVVLYNPDYEVLDNIISYAYDVDCFIVIDNSEVHNIEIIDILKNKFNNLLYINNKINLGIAKALNMICDISLENKCDWVLTMDQDSKFSDFKNYLKVLDKFYDHKKVAILCTNHNYEKNKNDNDIFTYSEEDLAITSGNFLNLRFFNKVGRFTDKLFIDEVDHDYCIRVKMLNLSILKFHNIQLEHSLGIVKNGITQHSAIRTYYGTRNNLYMSQKYGKYMKKYKYSKIFYQNIYKVFFRILRKEDDKLEKFFYLFRGVFDFIRGKYGKI